MADIKDFKHAIVRQKILEAVRKDLIGPSSVCEELNVMYRQVVILRDYYILLIQL